MKLTKTIILFLFAVPLFSQWQKTDYGFISSTPIKGEIRWLPELNKLVNAYNDNFKVINLSNGEIEEEQIFQSSDSTNINYSNDLNSFYVIKSKVLSLYPKNYVKLEISKFENDNETQSWSDTILFLENDQTDLRSSSINYTNINDSLIALNIDYQYGNSMDFFSEKSIIYNLKAHSYSSYNGFAKYFNPKSNIINFKDYSELQVYNPNQTSINVYNYIYNFSDKESYTFYFSHESNSNNLIMGNKGKNFILEENDKFYYYQLQNKIPIKLNQKINSPKGHWFFSENEQYILNLNNINSDEIFDIYSFDDLEKVNDYKLTITEKINFILFVDEEFVYALDEKGFLLKINIPFFDSKNLKANFSANYLNIVQGDSVLFIDKSSGNPIKWEWDFGDNTKSNIENPIHQFKNSGEYNIQLIVENINGDKDTTIKKAFINVNPNLKSDFDFEILSENPVTIKYTNKSEGEILKYLWNYGDGNLDSSENPSHIYKSNRYITTLTIFDKDNNYDQKVIEVYKNPNNEIDTNPNLYPSPKFSTNFLPTSANLTDIIFYNSEIGIILSDKGEIFRTNDGGNNWALIKKLNEFIPTRIRLLPNNEAIISSSSGLLYKSFDYGLNWYQFVNLGENSSIIDFDCLSYEECFLLSELNEINKIDKRGKLISKSEYSIELKYNIVGQIINRDPLKAIIKNQNRYIVGTNSIYVDNKVGLYLHSLISTNNFKYFNTLIDKDLLTLDNGTITEINNMNEKYVLYSLNNQDLYYFKLSSSYPPILIFKNDKYFDKFYSTDKLIVLPLSNGNLIIMDSLNYNTQTFDYRSRQIHLDKDEINGYFQITPFRGIAIGENGKYFITDFVTSIDEKSVLDDIKIYPNPISDELNIQFKYPEFVKSIGIYNLCGEKIQFIPKNSIFQILTQSTSTLLAGLYYLKIITNKGIYNKKIIKF